MNYIKCRNNHLYNADKFKSCPYCNEATGIDRTTAFDANSQKNTNATVDRAFFGLDKTAPLAASGDIKPTAGLVFEDRNQFGAEEKTVGFFPDIEPVVGWLVCTEGTKVGNDFKLKAGRNFIGRSADMDIYLEGEVTVSRGKHAVIVYDPMSGVFLAQPGEAKELFYVNKKVVLSPLQLNRNDRIRIGNVELLFVPLCDENFKWESKNTEGDK